MVADLQTLVRKLPAIKVRIGRAEDQLILEIEQDDGMVTIVLEGLGTVFRNDGDFL